MEKGILLFFNASWCKPCSKIKTLLNEEIKNIEKIVNINFIDIDTGKDHYNNDADYYSFLKSKRIIRGVPSLLLYIKTNEDDRVIYPDFFCETNISHFNALMRIIKNL